jgi:hypothetical protein
MDDPTSPPSHAHHSTKHPPFKGSIRAATKHLIRELRNFDLLHTSSSPSRIQSERCLVHSSFLLHLLIDLLGNCNYTLLVHTTTSQHLSPTTTYKSATQNGRPGYPPAPQSVPLAPGHSLRPYSQHALRSRSSPDPQHHRTNRFGSPHNPSSGELE